MELAFQWEERMNSHGQDNTHREDTVKTRLCDGGVREELGKPKLGSRTSSLRSDLEPDS